MSGQVGLSYACVDRWVIDQWGRGLDRCIGRFKSLHHRQMNCHWHPTFAWKPMRRPDHFPASWPYLLTLSDAPQYCCPVALLPEFNFTRATSLDNAMRLF